MGEQYEDQSCADKATRVAKVALVTIGAQVTGVREAARGPSRNGCTILAYNDGGAAAEAAPL